MSSVKLLIQDLNAYASAERKKTNEWFFKTGKGQYGQHDRFIGISVPDIRKVVKSYTHLSLMDLKEVLDDPIHEYRLAVLLILVTQYQTSDVQSREEIYQFYLTNKGQINNWDLVDSSAHPILGAYLYKNPEFIDVLYELAESNVLWDRRIAMISTFYFVKQGKVDLMLKISERLLKDKEDLMHKAVGWMLREGWKKEPESIEYFLMEYYSQMPRTALRYAIERMEEQKRKRFLKGVF